MIKAISPTWLQGPLGERYLYAVIATADATADRIEQGVRSCMPQKCDPTFLPSVGRDRSTIRGISESDETYAARCQSAIYDWHFAGLAAGLMRTVLGYISDAPHIRVVWSAKWSTSQPTQWSWLAAGASRGVAPETFSTLAATPFVAEWKWDAIDNRRRVWIVIDSGAWITSGRKYGDGSKYGDGHLYGVAGITANQVTTLRSLVAEWKGSHAYCAGIVVSLDSTLFDPFAITSPGANATLPDGAWANYGHDDGSGNYIAARFDAARYIGGTG